MVLYYQYLGPEILAGFDSYKYSSKDTSPLSQYVMHPFWDRVVKLCPMWVAPNLLTLVGFMCCVGHFLLLTIYDYAFRSSTAPPSISHLPDVKEGDHVGSLVWLGVAVLLFLSHTLDGIDGKQARRTGSSSPLGELFDHGLDAWATIFITGSIYSVFGRNEDNFSVPVFRMFCVFWNVYLCFLTSHWEKYNTGVLYLPWGYDVSMVGGVLLYLTTAVGGQLMWKVQLPGDISPGPVLEALLYLGSLGLTLPTALYNIHKSYKEGTGKNLSFLESIRPLVSTLVAMCLCFLWVLNSPNNILEADPRCMFYMTGTVFANICCKIIIAQMSNTRCELLSVILVPLAAASLVALLIPGLSMQGELTILYILTGVATLAHIHYGVCVLLEMCQHFHINAFSIKREDASEDTFRLLENQEVL